MNPERAKQVEREKWDLAAKICTLDFCYENSLVKIVANRNCPEIKLAGLTVGPFDEGNEYEIYFWVAKELAASGMVHFREDDILGRHQTVQGPMEGRRADSRANLRVARRLLPQTPQVHR